ncbi:hypothetical protein EVAR_13842_1 [Eumeta japonica]|uniref:Uncharacterized protein n=1 Tax=Eumeta variegata TaxID=151549 RepID=A0A4C1U1F1_EUMVA|nr:hypothetical protein EVAR_13842_1 [Eumeta japonica]
MTDAKARDWVSNGPESTTSVVSASESSVTAIETVIDRYKRYVQAEPMELRALGRKGQTRSGPCKLVVASEVVVMEVVVTEVVVTEVVVTEVVVTGWWP